MTNQIIIKLVRKSLADKHITNLSLFQNVYWEKVKDSATIRGVLGICLDGFDKQSKSTIFVLFKTMI